MPRIEYAGRELLTEEEVNEMIDKTESDEGKAIIALLYLSGARRGELLLLKRRDVWSDEKYLWVHFHTLKDRRGKVVASTRHNFFLLDNPKTIVVINYVKKIDEPDAKVFTISKWSMWKMIRKADETVWAHLFRHTRATRMAEKGATEQKLCAWFGWADVNSATRYVEKSVKLIEGMAELID